MAVADEQTQGRGRHGPHVGRAAGDGLLLSVRARARDVDAERLPTLTVVAAEALRRSSARSASTRR